MTRTLLCYGYGYTARHLAMRLGEDWSIAATTRDPVRAEQMRGQGVTPVLLSRDDLAEHLVDGTHLLVSAPPGEDGDPLLAAYRRALIEAAPRLAWAGYLSTTAVYGDRRGAWVDETTPVAPGSARGKRRAKAEADWLSLVGHGVPVHVFRLAGIYGPGRGPFEKVHTGTARRIVKPGQVFGRIHVDDIATALLASMARPMPGAIFNVTDDLTCPPQDVLEHAATLLGLPPPPEVAFEDADMSPMARSFYSENKRVSNMKLKRDLGVALAYPTYREGLAALLDHGGDPAG